MKTVQLALLCLWVWCPATESLIDKWVNLGENVTLDCNLGNKEIYWFFLKLPDSLVVILRTFTSESISAHFYDNQFKNKYSSQNWSRLIISNITADELGIYYCAKTVSLLQLNNGTRLYITETGQIQNETECNNHSQHQKTHQTLTVTSIALNGLMFITIIGLLMLRCKKPSKTQQQCQNVEPVHLEDLNVAQYSEIEFTTYSREEKPSQINGIYELLQNPKQNPQHTNFPLRITVQEEMMYEY
ncbi:uncharacterized protein LOC127438229 isoform X2 [Myxocyprinus asiaticus]|uniref:uncharacterized protein LOC127438229 isoform X2 n=1 Tax=Myxocyprinus asiaticus TaxID=70543 RepID=UPI002221B113|nr:uncharacterized protein LOC127438229 isoform X2 [Myxocyprinus asiaticus]